MNKRTLVVSTISALLFAASTAVVAHAESVMDTIAHTPSMSTATKLIKEAGLADSLQGPGPVTVFVPNDAAFAALPKETTAELSTNKDMLKSLLSYHIVSAALTLDTLSSGNQKTSNGANISVYKSGTFLTVENAVVVHPDLKASNGVIQEIDTVLIPPKK